MLFEPNDKFYDEVLASQEAAEAAGIGLFADDVACTVPAQVREYADAVADLPAGPGTLEEIDGWAAEAAAVAATGVALVELLDGDGSVFPMVSCRSDRWTYLRDDVARDNGRVAEVQERLVTERTDEERRIEREKGEEAERKAKEEAERKAREDAERKAQEEAERQAQQAAEQAAREEADRQAQAAGEQARRRQSASTSMSTSGGDAAPAPAAPSAYDKNCSAARAAGAAPVVVGQPGYGRHLDRDGDGVGCE
ncbi:excalibur calcium-binding domain-containing protein [Georgenia sp. 10Sc9-8]|uniref:Excalibur calcium-binding domain-containing protein n=1 Tax=Georgenia halotolerans TaxID=3028317 RepID=A0ABT5TV72_9MICO|nr:excalibur calcium-binding domain-containing protein [Georgenia halotolerans]